MYVVLLVFYFYLYDFKKLVGWLISYWLDFYENLKYVSFVYKLLWCKNINILV